jgi:tRNA (cmo5U34)-methyltransferase
VAFNEAGGALLAARTGAADVGSTAESCAVDIGWPSEGEVTQNSNAAKLQLLAIFLDSRRTCPIIAPRYNTAMKSTVAEIRARFDADVERFSNLETGQSATIDAPVALDLIAEAAAGTTPKGARLLDVGCGAGNFSLKLLERLPGLAVTLVDLSRLMLDRATSRLQAAGCSKVTALQGDIRELELGAQSQDIILAAAVLHHLRTDDEWRLVFRRFYEALTPGGSLWIFDLVEGATPVLQELAWRRYGGYLVQLGGEAYRDRVFAYIEQEDTPRPLYYQLRLLEEAGFARLDVLHKNGPFAAFGAVK